jgi:predicted deacylase
MSWIDDLPAGYRGWRTWQATADACLEVFCCRGRPEGPVALITAGVHGDEYEGPAGILSLARTVSPDRLQGTVIAVPVVNPAAFAAGTRLHPEDGANLARTFPGKVNGGPTERLAAAVFTELVTPADYVIDLHSGGLEYVFVPVAGFYGDPHPANRSFDSARCFGLPVLWKLPPTEGVLSYEAWRRDKIAIGTEYRGAGQLSADGARDYCAGILGCLAHWGMLASSSEQPSDAAVLEGDWQLASASGIFVASCRPGDAVGKDAVLASIVGARGEMLQEFTASSEGVILGLRSKAYIRAGNWGVLVGRRVEVD